MPIPRLVGRDSSIGDDDEEHVVPPAAASGTTRHEERGVHGSRTGQEIHSSALDVSNLTGYTRNEPPSELDYKDLGRDYESVMNVEAVPPSLSSSPPPRTIQTTQGAANPNNNGGGGGGGVPIAQALPMGYVADQGEKQPAIPHYQGYAHAENNTNAQGGGYNYNYDQRPGAYRGGYTAQTPAPSPYPSQPPPTAAWDPLPPPATTSVGNYPPAASRSEPIPWWRKNVKWVLLGVGAVVVVVLSASIGAALAGGGGDDDRGPENDDNVHVTRKSLPSKVELIRSVDSVVGGDNETVYFVESEYGRIEDWDVSQITDFSNLFDASERNPNFRLFNADISKWNTSSATSTKAMFRNVAAFNQGTWQCCVRRDVWYAGKNGETGV